MLKTREPGTLTVRSVTSEELAALVRMLRFLGPSDSRIKHLVRSFGFTTPLELLFASVDELEERFCLHRGVTVEVIKKAGERLIRKSVVSEDV